MGHIKLKSCPVCCSASEQYGSIDNGGMFCPCSSLRSDSAANQPVEQKKRSFDEMQVIRMHMGFLSMQSMASLSKVPKTEKVDGECAENDCCYETKSIASVRSREIELCCEPLPKDWEQFLDLESGKFYYINKSSGKRTKRDPRPILKEIQKDINAPFSSACGNTEGEDSESCLSTNSSNKSSGILILKRPFECKKSVEHDARLAILK
ncbi:hypothetical protein KI387_027711, partial [Taxus chinensis]